MYKMPLVVGDKTIQRISGPVSCTVLKPTDKFLKLCADSGVFAPVYLLFGDYHFSTEGMCNKCLCNPSDSEKRCCYPVYSEEFLKLFDTIVESKNFPISVYSEGIHNIDDEKNQESREYPLDQFAFKNLSCYNRTLKYNDRENPCPYKNLKWHAGDARFLISKNYFYEKIVEEYTISITKLYNKYVTSNLENLDITDVIDKLANMIPKSNDRFDVLSSIIRSTDNIYSEDFYNNIFNSKHSQYSIIHKQFLKLPSSLIKQKIYRNIYRLRETDKLEKYIALTFINEAFEKAIKDKRKIREAVQEINREFNIIRNINKISRSDFEDIMISYISIFLDMYTVFRSLKFLNSEENQNLVIGYFGDSHRKKTSNLLCNILEFYTEDIILRGPYHLRCLKFNNHDINILDILYTQKYKYLKYLLLGDHVYTREELNQRLQYIHQITEWNHLRYQDLFNLEARENIRETIDRIQEPLYYDINIFRVLTCEQNNKVVDAHVSKDKTVLINYLRNINISDEYLFLLTELDITANDCIMIDEILRTRNLNQIIISEYTLLQFIKKFDISILIDFLIQTYSCVIDTNFYTDYRLKYQSIPNIKKYDIFNDALQSFNFHYARIIINHSTNEELNSFFDIIEKNMENIDSNLNIEAHIKRELNVKYKEIKELIQRRL